MLYKNNELVTEKDKEFKLWLQNTWKFLPEQVVFMHKEGRPRNKRHDGSLGEFEPIKRYSIDYRANAIGPSGTEAWRYTEQFPDSNEHGVLTFKDSRMNLEVETIIQKGKSDLLFFLMTKCPSTKNDFKIQNRHAEAREQINVDSIRTEVEYLIKNGKSALVKDERQFRFLSRSWNVPGADVLTIPELQLELFAKVIDEEKRTHKGYSKFLEDYEKANDNVLIRIKALIRQSIDLGIVIDNVEKNTYQSVDGKIILNILPNEIENRFHVLADYLLLYPDILSSIQVQVDAKVKPFVPPMVDETLEEINTSNELSSKEVIQKRPKVFSKSKKSNKKKVT
jgi:hypothetical protein